VMSVTKFIFFTDM